MMTELVLPELIEPKLPRPRPVPATAYEFVGPAGRVTLAGLFGGHRLLAVHHTMPSRSRPGAVMAADQVAAALHTAGTRLVIVSYAPYAKVEQYGRHFGLGLPGYSAVGAGFGADFPATLYLEGACCGDSGGRDDRDETPGLSFFALDSEVVCHLGSIAVPYLDFLELADVTGARRLG
jgi:predicted dithiol-disulfide oxidoreductase (DUF899 family)